MKLDSLEQKKLLIEIIKNVPLQGNYEAMLNTMQQLQKLVDDITQAEIL